MKRRNILSLAILCSICFSLSVLETVTAAQKLISVQVRVYRSKRPGSYEFLAGVPVVLSNGLKGTTRDKNGVKGTVEFPNLPQANYSATAKVGGKIYPTTSKETISATLLRVNIQVP